jgi:hypothetical protein
MPGVTDLAVDVLFRTRSPQEAAAVAERWLRDRRAAHATVEVEQTWRPPEPPA